MKKFNIVMFILFTAICFNCKAQQIPDNQYSTNIIGTWILEEDTNQKLEFTAAGICKVFEEGVLHTTYEYSFENNSCGSYTTNDDVVYLKWKEVGQLETSCLEVSGMTTNTLSLMIIDNAQVLYYTR